jgi:hypothetical protein
MKPLQISPANKSSSAWDEIHDVFGDGHEYDWALEADDEVQYDEDNLKPEMRYQDVSAITPQHIAVMLTSPPIFRYSSHRKSENGYLPKMMI